MTERAHLIERLRKSATDPRLGLRVWLMCWLSSHA
jgi:hypothetical protein